MKMVKAGRIVIALAVAGICFLISGTPSQAAEPPVPAGPMTGTMPQFQLTKRMSIKWYKYLDGSSKSGMVKFYKYRAKVAEEDSRTDEDLKDLLDYEIEKQSALVHIPEGYTGKEAYGILLHLGDEETAALPEGWETVLAERKLIYAQPHKSGSLWSDPRRIALAMDTLETLLAEYKIDKKRIIISGSRTGGAIAQIMGIVYRETFTGVISHGYGLMLRRTNYGKDDDRNRRHRDDDDIDRTVWDSQVSFIGTKDLKRTVKEKVDIVLYTDSGAPFEHERVMLSAGQWAQLGVPLLIIDDPQRTRSFVMPAEWLDKAVLFIDGYIVKTPPPRIDQYDVRMDLKENNKDKKPIPEKKEEKPKEDEKKEKDEEK